MLFTYQVIRLTTTQLRNLFMQKVFALLNNMALKGALAIVALIAWTPASAVIDKISADEGQGKPAAQYLPAETTYNPAIPTPESYLGAQVGEWHVRHDQLVGYMRLLAEKSDRVTVQETGRTHENRPLLLLTITSTNNQRNIDSLRENHISKLQKGQADSEDAPLILYMGYSIHGNEPSGANASMLIAYYLSAGQSEKVNALLQNNIVLLDPSFNPDGLSRFAQWANMHKGKQLVSDPEHREHAEGWPSGRTNHYWFDLNRDWLLLTHPESRARIAQMQRWRPHILTDFHEMGPNSSYFFQPGVPSRKNPNTPEGNVRLTEALAEFHIEAFDKQGQLYFSEEGFDDFYYGKGSSYPDSLGSIGILFEQASSRGHVQDTINGKLTFSDTIQNQVTTSLSTFAGAMANKPAIRNYQREFAQSTQKLINKDKHAGYVLARPDDIARFDALLSLLDQHKIEYSWLTENTKIDKRKFNAGQAIYVPVDQPGYRLVKSLFSTRTDFVDNTFYDVSNWNLPLAFNVDYAPVASGDAGQIETGKAPVKQSFKPLPEDAYAYAINWQHYYSPAALQRLLEAGAMVRSAQEAFTASLSSGKPRDFAAGTIILPTGLEQPDDLPAILSAIQSDFELPVHALRSGHTTAGIDIGSSSMVPIDAPSVLLVGGRASSEYEVGEIWHYLDTRVGLAATLVEEHRLGSINLNNYSHIIFASGDYNQMNDKVARSVTRWVKQGGTLIGVRTALRLFADQQWLPLEIVDKEKIEEAFSTEGLTYADRGARYAKKLIAGAVYNTNIDPTHPIFFGYEQAQLPMFKTTNMIVETDNSPFTTPATYVESPLMAGYSASQLTEMVGQTAAVVADDLGRGVVIGFVDDIHFRGYWRGTDKLMSNAIYQSAHLK